MQIHRCIENPVRHLKWSKKELLAKIVTAWIQIPPNFQIFQGSEYARYREGSEHIWICSWIMLRYAWICLKQNLKSIYKLHTNCRCIGVFRILSSLGLEKWSRKESLAKNNCGLELFLEDITICLTGNVNTVELLNIPGFCICREF